jgi:hypothetical protein
MPALSTLEGVERDASSSSQHDNLEDNGKDEEKAWNGQIGLGVLNSYKSFISPKRCSN